MAAVNFKNVELVDRKEEFKLLQDYLEEVIGGTGLTVFISGEAGIGKTRIVEEIIPKAEGMGFKIIRGQCIPENFEPLFPFKSALKRAGLEHLLSNKPPPLVLSVYLIDSSGLVIAKAERKETSLDPDIFVGMLTAIEAFVKDSLKIMGREENATLNSLSYGDYNILIQSNSKLSLATVIRGEPNEFLIEDMKNYLDALTDKFEDWHGEVKAEEEARPFVEWFIKSKKYDGKYLAGEPSIVQENIFDNILLGLQRLSERNPLIVFIDDLQWADNTSLNFLYYLSRNTRSNRIMIIGTYRPEEIIPSSGGELHPLEVTLNNLAGDRLVRVIGLQRLSRDDTMILISRILGDFEQAIGEKIYKESGGNPLFIIEIIKLLMAEKLIYKEEKRWKLKVEADKIIIPRRAYELIKRRLERLSDEEREILDVASVIGDVFDTALLSAVTGMDELTILKRLNNIYRKHKLIHVENGRYRFEHSIIREVLYNELLDELRRKYHRVIGDIIYELNRDNLEQVKNVLAHHYYQARDDRAVRFLLEMGDNARRNYANDEALNFYQRALEIADDPDMKVRCLESMGDVLVYLGKYDEAEKKYQEVSRLTDDILILARMKRKIADIKAKTGNYEDAITLLEEARKQVHGKSPLEEGRVLSTMGKVQFMRGEYRNALEYYKDALHIFTSIKGNAREPKRGIAETVRGVADIHLMLGNYDKAKKYYTMALQISREMEDMKAVAEVLADMGNLYLAQGDLEKALRIYLSSLNIMKNVGFKLGIANLLNSIGNVYLKKGDLDKALERYRQSLEINEKINQKSAMGKILNNIGNIHFLRGDDKGALEVYMDALKISREIGDKHTSAHTLMSIGRIYLMQKRILYAEKIIKAAQELINEIGDRQGMIEALIAMAEVQMHRKNYRSAEEKANEALRIAEELDSKDGKYLARRVLGNIYRERGEYRKAVIEYTKAMRHFKASNNEYELARTYFEYALMWKKRGDRNKAQEYLEKARDIFRKSGAEIWAKRCEYEMRF